MRSLLIEGDNQRDNRGILEKLGDISWRGEEIREGRETHDGEEAAVHAAEAFFAHDAGRAVHEAAEARARRLGVVDELRSEIHSVNEKACLNSSLT